MTNASRNSTVAPVLLPRRPVPHALAPTPPPLAAVTLTRMGFQCVTSAFPSIVVQIAKTAALASTERLGHACPATAVGMQTPRAQPRCAILRLVSASAASTIPLGINASCVPLGL